MKTYFIFLALVGLTFGLILVVKMMGAALLLQHLHGQELILETFQVLQFLALTHS